jgi:hypothetical protein
MPTDQITRGLLGAKPYFMTFTPGPGKLFNGTAAKIAKAVGLSWYGVKVVRDVRAGKPVSTVVGEKVGGKIIGKVTSPVSARVTRAHLRLPHQPRRDFWRKNGLGGRSWMNEPGRHEMVIIYHDANKAGKHIDVHLGHLSMIYRVKPELEAQLRFNRDGYLTEDSKKAIIDHVRWEINNGSRLPQNLDHSLTNARASWVGGDPEGKNYGDGVTRQVVDISVVDVYKAFADGPIEFYAPHLNPHRSMYIYQIYPGDGKRAPILIWGNKGTQPPKLEDRLHLKMVDPKLIDTKLPQVADMSTATAKYDGSSCYVVIGPKGTTVWSPRQSAKTGEQIEYTHKMRGLTMAANNGETIVAMGEIMFLTKPTLKERILDRQKPEYLPCAQGSGLLNSNSVLPDGVEPVIYLYRVDQVGRRKMGDLDFWENRELQERVASMAPQHLKVVELMSAEEAQDRGFEGIVVVPEGGSVNDGYKIKWWMDPHDWRIDDVGFFEGPRGGVAGVVTCTSLESGKRFYLGPGQMGDHELCHDMALNPDDYIGTTVKVQSRHGHEGRAAKVMQFHDDK